MSDHTITDHGLFLIPLAPVTEAELQQVVAGFSDDDLADFDARR